LARLIDASGFGSSLKDVPTPMANDRCNTQVRYDRSSATQTDRSLETFVRTFPTPCAIDATGGRINRSDSPGAAERPTLARLVTRGDVQPGPVTLSAEWVEWLMGWPIGWTDLRGTPTPWGGWHEEPVPRVTPARRPKTRARLRCIGNGQVPQCAAAAWVALRARREAAP
jgi:DNA (cytosine-5)-methyltransferase 1